MKKSVKKLVLNPQSIRVLAVDALADVAGGWIRRPITLNCPQPGSAPCQVE